MDNKNFRHLCNEFNGRYDEQREECVLGYESYAKLKEFQKATQRYSRLDIGDINSGRDTNLGSFNTYDEIVNEDGTLAIRRPNIVNIYHSNVELTK